LPQGLFIVAKAAKCYRSSTKQKSFRVKEAAKQIVDI